MSSTDRPGRSRRRIRASRHPARDGIVCRTLGTPAAKLERVIDKRPQADRILAAQLTGEAKHHAGWRDLTGHEEAAAVAELRELAGGRPDLLAEVAGIFEGTSEGEPDEPRAPGRGAVPQVRGRPGGNPGVDRGGAAPESRRQEAALMLAIPPEGLSLPFVRYSHDEGGLAAIW